MWPNLQFPKLATFTEEILEDKLNDQLWLMYARLTQK